MPLPSQMPRTNRQASFRSDSQRRNSRLGALAVAAILVSAGSFTAVKFLQTAEGPAPASAGTQASVLPTREAIGLNLAEPQGKPSPALERTLPQPDPKPVAPASTSPQATSSTPSSSPVTTTPPKPTSTTEPNTIAPPTAEPAAPSAPAPTAPVTTVETTPQRDPSIQKHFSAAESSAAAGRLHEARLALNRALHDPRTSDRDVELARQRLTDINAQMFFSPVVTPGDPMVEAYTVQEGDRLVSITRSRDLRVDWRLIQRVNRMSNPGMLRVGQKLKLIKGPFHAVVWKRAYRLDLYSDLTDQDGNRIYLRSFAVGLGEQDSTPPGSWFVRPSSKLVNPHWVNPRTGERFAADDPKNPIGEFWLGLTGADTSTQVLSGYGIHGTIEPDSIGRDASMGCVRMLSDDIALIYEALVETHSTVHIHP